MFDDIGPVEIILILVVIMIVFGAGKLPSVGRDLGKSIREFRQAMSGKLDNEKKTDAKTSAEVQLQNPENTDKDSR